MKNYKTGLVFFADGNLNSLLTLENNGNVSHSIVKYLSNIIQILLLVYQRTFFINLNFSYFK